MPMSSHNDSRKQEHNRSSARSLASLEEWFRSFDSALVAFSSGVDSSVLAFAAKQALGEKAIAVNSLSVSFAESERMNVELVAREIGVQLLFVNQDDLGSKGYVANQVNRCYFCRANLASAMLPLIKERRISVCVDGTHIDDMRSPRPGVKALRENGFRAPFVELGFDKSDVRAVARLIGLSNADRPAEACLSSRVAYGQRIDEPTLRRIEDAENYVRELVNPRIVRVRTTGSKAVIEVDKESIERASSHSFEIEKGLRRLGYSEVSIDPEGYSSGRMLSLYVADFKEE